MMIAIHLLLLLMNRVDFLESTLSFGSFFLNPSVSSTIDIIVTPNNDTSLSVIRSQQSQIFRSKIADHIKNDKSIAGPLVRLAFHDAATYESNRLKYTLKKNEDDNNFITGGPNGSIRYELDRSENRGLRHPLTVVENILQECREKEKTQNSWTISLADAIALAGATAIEASGGPNILIRLGRPDSTISDPYYLRRPLQERTKRSLVTTALPSAGLDSDGLRLYYSRFGLTEAEFVALQGVHGMGRHVSLLNMTKACLKNLTRDCLENAPVLLPFVTESVDIFDNSYFSALLRWNDQQVSLGEVAFIPTDVSLVVDGDLRRYVELYANDNDVFYRVFRRGFQKLVDTTATTNELY
jgi:L-ascorbate peroxidase